ncbi:MAG: sensory rhodopsin transducer [Eubacteriales bacterium]
MKAYGKKVWLIPDCFLESISKSQLSHEAICVINTSDEDAKIDLTLFFEDRPSYKGFSSQCGAAMTHHIRMDKIRAADGSRIPLDTPYAVLVESSCPIVVQYSRLDTASAEMALMTTIAYPVEE